MAAVRPILDPENIAPVVGDVTIDILPRSIRTFGHAPAIDRLLPGDLLLFKPVVGQAVSRLIARAQERGGFAAEHAARTHAAIFLYDDVMVEALPLRGVVQRSLYSRSPGHCMLVRRHAAHSEQVRYRIALWALGRIGERYSHLGVLGLAWHLLNGLWSDAALTRDRLITICGQVYADAHGEMSDSRLRGCPYAGISTPAHLSATPDLVDVAIGWENAVLIAGSMILVRRIPVERFCTMIFWLLLGVGLKLSFDGLRGLGLV